MFNNSVALSTTFDLSHSLERHGCFADAVAHRLPSRCTDRRGVLKIQFLIARLNHDFDVLIGLFLREVLPWLLAKNSVRKKNKEDVLNLVSVITLDMRQVI